MDTTPLSGLPDGRLMSALEADAAALARMSSPAWQEQRRRVASALGCLDAALVLLGSNASAAGVAAVARARDVLGGQL